MLVYRIVLGIVCIVATFVARLIYPHAYKVAYRTRKSLLASVFFWIFGIISVVTGLIFAVWSINNFINDFSLLNWIIPTVFITIEAIAITGDAELGGGFSLLAIIIGFIAVIIHGVIWVINYESPYVDCNDKHVEISTIEIISASDGTAVNGKISTVWRHVYGYINETPVYRYYYQLPDGGIKIGEIPVNSTTIYYIEDGKEPYIEVIKTSACDYYNPQTGEHLIMSTSTSYKLYVPKGSIADSQFDGN